MTIDTPISSQCVLFGFISERVVIPQPSVGGFTCQ